MTIQSRAICVLSVLAVLAAADAVTTHIGLTLGTGIELNPLFGPLLPSPLGWLAYALIWGVAISWAWWCRPRCGGTLWIRTVGAIVVLKGSCVVWNIRQLMLS